MKNNEISQLPLVFDEPEYVVTKRSFLEMETVEEVMRHIMTIKGISVKEMAARIDEPENIVSKWFMREGQNGKVYPPVRKLRRVMLALDSLAPLEWLAYQVERAVIPLPTAAEREIRRRDEEIVELKKKLAWVKEYLPVLTGKLQ